MGEDMSGGGINVKMRAVGLIGAGASIFGIFAMAGRVFAAYGKPFPPGFLSAVAVAIVFAVSVALLALYLWARGETDG